MKNNFEIKKLKGKGNYGKHVFYDCETIDMGFRSDENIQIHKAYLICAEVISFKIQAKQKNKTGKRKMHTSNFESTKVEEFWTLLENHIANTSKLTIWAFNQGFDSRVSDTLKYFFNQGWKREMFVVDRGCFIVSIKKSFGKDRRGKEVNKKIIFQDLGNYFKGSLAKIGKSLGVEKGDFDHKKAKNFVTICDETKRIVNVDEEHKDFVDCLKYCKQDVKILKEGFLSLNSFAEEHGLGNIGYTAAGMAMNAWRTRFLPKKVFAHQNKSVREMERTGYFGGRVVILKEGEYEGNFYKIDVNSMYPAMMQNNVYPKELKAFIEKTMGDSVDEEIEYIEQRVKKGRLALVDCDIMINEPILPHKINKKGGFFPVGRYRTVITNMELEKIKDVGKIEKIYKYVFYMGGDMFNDFVKFFYEQRQKYKEAKNNIFEQCCKLMMNSLYGKFAQYKIVAEKIGEVDDGSIVKKEVIVLHDTKEVKQSLTIGGVVTGKEERLDTKKNTMTAVSLFVTSYARLFLWETIKKVGVENVFYGDTDSLILNEEGYKKILNLLDDKKLGFWDLEDTTDRIKIISPKVYWFGGQLKHKGLSRDNIKELEQNFKKTGKYPLDKNFTQIRFMQTKTAINKGSLSGVEIGEMEYNANYELTQGWIVENGDVVPLKVEENRVLNFEQSYPQLKLKYHEQQNWIDKKYNT